MEVRGASHPIHHTATVRSLANLAAASAPAAAARRSQARRGAHPPQDTGVHLRPATAPPPPPTAACPRAYAGGGGESFSAGRILCALVG